MFFRAEWPDLCGEEINTSLFRFTLSSGLSRGGDLSSGWSLKRVSTVYIYACFCVCMYIWMFTCMYACLRVYLLELFTPPP